MVENSFIETCPYGVPGDRLWVREKFQPLWEDYEGQPPEDADYQTGKGYYCVYPATDGVAEFEDWNNDCRITKRVTPSIHMPRWACRLLLEITSIRVERLQDINEYDAEAEGVGGEATTWLPTYIGNFRTLWDSLNAKRDLGWDVNPWVWVIEFKRLEATP